MNNKYIALVYEEDMNDILKTANVINTYQGMRVDADGRFNDMAFYEIGFDYKVWRELRNNKIDIDYLDDLDNLYSLQRGRCNNRNVVVHMKDMVDEELAKAKAIKEQIALREKLIASGDEAGVVEYVSKKSKIVPNKKAMSLVAYNSENELVMPFREIVHGTSDYSIFIYLHDKKSRGTTNATLIVKECKDILASMKAVPDNYIIIIPNVIMEYETTALVDGARKIVSGCYNKLLDQIVAYEVQTHDANPNKVYLMGVGSGVADAMNVIEQCNTKFAASVMAFGMGDYGRFDNYKGMSFQVASASKDEEYSDVEISNFVEDLKDAEIEVNYIELDGEVQQATKMFYKDLSWLNSTFSASRNDVDRAAILAAAPVKAEVKEEATAAEEIAPASESAAAVEPVSEAENSDSAN